MIRMRQATPMRWAATMVWWWAAIGAVEVGSTHTQEVVSHDLQVPGGAVHYEVAGEGPAVVLLHGGMMDRRMWDPQFRMFAAAYRVIRLDLRGAGASTPPTGAFQPADDVIAILDELGIEKTAVVALSMGGATAIDLALTYPDRVEALVLGEPAVSGYTFGPEVMQVMMTVSMALQNNDLDGAMDAYMQSEALRFAGEQPDVRQRLELMIRENLKGLMSMMQIRFHESQAFERLGDIRAPVLLLSSEHASADARNIAARLASDVTNITAVTIHDSGHMMNLEQPERFNTAVLDFLGNHL